MKKLEYKGSETISSLRNISKSDSQSVLSVVKEIIYNIKTRGDSALIEYAQRFDKLSSANMLISQDEISQAANNISESQRAAVELAIERITKYHKLQLRDGYEYEDESKFKLGQLIRPINRVGLYIPGGSAALFSTLIMLLVPAKLAGVESLSICTPTPDGLNPSLAYILNKFAITEVYRIGGAQAIAAMAYGTETIKKVDKIFGPGNSYVNEAKKQILSEGLAIDLPAGPSEILVIADQNANPDIIASDLLAQAEHGPDSLVVLATNNNTLVSLVEESINKLLTTLPKSEIIKESLSRGAFILCKNIDECFEFSNNFAPEHLSIQLEDSQRYLQKVLTAGSVFIGEYSPEALGDYISGPNHVLPTIGAASAYSGLTVSSFQKTISWQMSSVDSLKALGSHACVMARAEGLEAHALSIEMRIKGG